MLRFFLPRSPSYNNGSGTSIEPKGKGVMSPKPSNIRAAELDHTRGGPGRGYKAPGAEGDVLKRRCRCSRVWGLGFKP